MQPFLCIKPVSATYDGIHQTDLQSSLLWYQFDLKSVDMRRISWTEVQSIQLDEK